MNNKSFSYQPIFHSQTYQVDVNSLDFFLLERYVTFSATDTQLYSERIHHIPYVLSDVDLLNYQSNLFEVNHFQSPSHPPTLFHYCHALDVSFFPLERIL